MKTFILLFFGALFSIIFLKANAQQPEANQDSVFHATKIMHYVQRNNKNNIEPRIHAKHQPLINDFQLNNDSSPNSVSLDSSAVKPLKQGIKRKPI